MAIATNEAFGADEVTDLLMANIKGPDYVGHAYGPDSPEMKEQMAELDSQITRLLEVLGGKAGERGLLVAITADHGMPAEPAPDDATTRTRSSSGSTTASIRLGRSSSPTTGTPPTTRSTWIPNA